MPSHLHCSNFILLLTCVNPNGAYIVFNENPADDSITNGVPYSSSGLRLLRHHLLHILLDIVLDGGEDLGLGHVDEVIYIGRIIV